jgi:hypothetical protein
MFKELDAEQLGRIYWNWLKGTDRRKPWVIRKKLGNRHFNYHVDRRASQTIILTTSRTNGILRDRAPTPPRFIGHEQIVGKTDKLIFNHALEGPYTAPG